MLKKKFDSEADLMTPYKGQPSNKQMYYGVWPGLINLLSICIKMFMQQSVTGVHAIWSYNKRWDFPRAGSSLFLTRFSGLMFLRFLGPFLIFYEIFAIVCEPGHRKLSFTLSNVYTQE